MKAITSCLIAAYVILLSISSVEVASAQQSTKKKATTTKKAKLKKSQKGALIGVGAGAVIGGIIGKNNKNTAIGAIIGATVGGAAGAVIGNHMDKQAEKLREDLGSVARVERVGEGVKLTFDNALLFDFGSFLLRSETQESLRNMAQTLKKDQQTHLLVEGHTDNVGSAEFNRELSDKRAQAVSNFLVAEGVSTERFKVIGQGEANPIATNSTEVGRQQNRRVEIGLYASDEMKKSAQNGAISLKQ
ncbi:OmpA family protein [Runella sp.]|uniref:OmpA family protein n=1 Tax=Runella sp. TaxID=1960881 RepID=UPI003D149D0C